MRKFLLASHGSFASGIKSSLEMITGGNDNIFTIGAYTEGNKSIESEIEIILNGLKSEDELIVFTDIAGGSITGEILRLSRKENIYVIAGMNLPLLLDIILADPDAEVNEVIENGIANAREQILFVSKLLNSNTEIND
jgi:fructoselysine/glucoselysine PTS system EIIA component